MEKYNENEELMQSKPMAGTENGTSASGEDSWELEQMREQLGILKKKLDKQAIVTDGLIQLAMRQKMSWITKYCWFASCFIFPFICLVWWLLMDILGISLFSYLLLVVFTGCCIFLDCVVNRMKPEDWDTDNLMQTAEKLARMKRVRKWQTIIQMTLLVPVLLLIGYDVYSAGVLPVEEMRTIGLSALIGLLIGGTIGLCILAKMQNTNDEVIQQIEEMKKNQG